MEPNLSGKYGKAELLSVSKELWKEGCWHLDLAHNEETGQVNEEIRNMGDIYIDLFNYVLEAINSKPE